MPRAWGCLLNARTLKLMSFPAGTGCTSASDSLGRIPVVSAANLCTGSAKSVFVSTFGKKLLQPKKSNTLNNDGSAILYGIGYEQWKDKRLRRLWDGDFIQYQNYLQINVLKELLGISSVKADVLVQKYPIFHFTDSELIKESFNYLTEMGVTIERILKMPSLLSIDSGQMDVKSKEIMRLLNITTFNTAAPFLELQQNRLFYLSRLWKSELKPTKVQDSSNRLYYLSEHLKCEPFEVADMMRKVPSIMSMSFSLLTKKLQLLFDGGVQVEDIVKDPYIFTHNLSAIKQQLEICRKAKCLPVIKPWMLRCTEEKINDHIQRLELEQELLASHGDIIGYLQDALECESAQIHELLTRVPTLKSVSAIKLNEMIKYLYSRGFTAGDIMSNPYILLHSQVTVEERLSELTSFGYETKQLPSILCWSSRRYKSFIRSLMAQEVTLTVKQT